MKVNTNVHRFESGLESKWFFCSDIHFDARKCNRKVLKEHFDKAKEEGRRIAILGDFFDAMGANKDPRSKPADVRPEYYKQDKEYLDSIIEDGAKFLSEYKDNIAVILYGNHETSIQRHHDTDILKRLVKEAGLSESVLSGYRGFVVDKLAMGGCHTKEFTFLLNHGYGGNAKRSKGVLNNQIDGFVYPDADCIISGHTHQKWHDPSNCRTRLIGNNIVIDNQHVFQCGSYKESSAEPFGWEVEKGFSPTRTGGWFIDLKIKRVQTGGLDQRRVILEATEGQ